MANLKKDLGMKRILNGNSIHHFVTSPKVQKYSQTLQDLAVKKT